MSTYGYPNPLNQISMFVLLDRLGGAGGPEIPSYIQTSAWAYRAMSTVEARMRLLGLLETRPARHFLPQTGKRAAEFTLPPRGNDHEPFMERGVPVLALYPEDDGAAGEPDDDGGRLDPAAVRDWARIVTGFALEWLDMMEVEPVQARRRAARRER